MACPRIVKNRLKDVITFVAPNRIAALDTDDPEKSEIADFPGGHGIDKLRIAAVAASLATEPKYLLLRGNRKEAITVFDWNANGAIQAQEQGEMDLVGQTLATYSPQGELSLHQVQADNRSLESKVDLPAPSLTGLRIANASPTLDRLVLGISGDAGLFRSATGIQIMSLAPLKGAWFSGDGQLYVGQSNESNSTISVKKVNSGPETATGSWWQTFTSEPRLTILDTHFSGPVLLSLQQSAIFAFADGHIDSPGHQRRDSLHALDLTTGNELWSREWVHNPSTAPGAGSLPRTWYDPPVPFADPQGDRVVLAWRAMASGGQALAKRNPAVKRALDAANLTINDTIFEVLEAASGKNIGTVLVQEGAGPQSFDTVFSVGDSLICVRDAARVTVYSLPTGEIQARVYGHHISASAPSNLLATAEGNRLKLYKLRSGANVSERLFPDALVYLHFSEAGNQLLVITSDQYAYVINVDAQNQAGDDSHRSQ